MNRLRIFMGALLALGTLAGPRAHAQAGNGNGVGSAHWRTSGNSNTGQPQFLGTTDNSSLDIRTNGQTRLLVEGAGMVKVPGLGGQQPSLLGSQADGTLFRVSDPAADSLFDCSVKLYRATGNYLTPDCFLGSTNPAPLRIHTSNTERMRVTEQGMVGIGTSQPAAMLHLHSATNAELRIQGETAAAPPTLGFYGGPAGQGTAFGQMRAGFNTSTLRPELSIEMNGQGGMATLMTLDRQLVRSSAPLAVGTGQQQGAALSVAGGMVATEQGNVGNFIRLGHNGTEAYLEHGSNAASSSTPSRLHINAGGGRTDFGGMVMMGDRLGIGTTSFLDNASGKEYRLSVDGRIRAKEIKVYSSWADYVFETGYELMPLADVEAYIAQNGHLPGIPSASEVEANGVELGESQAQLLAKIEELTLHLIRLEKENKALEERVQSLER